MRGGKILGNEGRRPRGMRRGDVWEMRNEYRRRK